MSIAVGDFEIRTVVESSGLAGIPHEVFPDATPEAIAPYLHWLAPAAYDRHAGQLLMPVQAYLVRTRHCNILLDTCVGNHKSHPGTEYHQHTEYTLLEDLAAAGVAPEAIDVVMCSHLHVDHAGWNTKLVDGRWVPSFPNARYIFSRKEVAFSERLAREEGESIYAESVQPVLEAGLAEIVAADFALDHGCWFEPTHGHTPGHVAIHLQSGGRRAVMSGDLIHSPLQLPHPEWSPIYDADPIEGAATRRRFLESMADSDILMMTQHFPAPSWGHIFRRGDGFGMRYLGCDMVHG